MTFCESDRVARMGGVGLGGGEDEAGQFFDGEAENFLTDAKGRVF
jgi:hypothetical protein